MRRSFSPVRYSVHVDFGLYKTLRLPAALGLMVRLDAFNVFNHPTWSFPVTDFNAANFGVINATNYSPRTSQLGFRFLY